MPPPLSTTVPVGPGLPAAPLTVTVTLSDCAVDRLGDDGVRAAASGRRSRCRSKCAIAIAQKDGDIVGCSVCDCDIGDAISVEIRGSNPDSSPPPGAMFGALTFCNPRKFKPAVPALNGAVSRTALASLIFVNEMLPVGAALPKPETVAVKS
jgi:hypothetical protein